MNPGVFGHMIPSPSNLSKGMQRERLEHVRLYIRLVLVVIEPG